MFDEKYLLKVKITDFSEFDSAIRGMGFSLPHPEERFRINYVFGRREYEAVVKLNGPYANIYSNDMSLLQDIFMPEFRKRGHSVESFERNEYKSLLNDE